MKIALASGHHNTDPGNQVEIEIVGRVVAVLDDELRHRGADVRTITPNDGQGMYPGGLYQAAAQVVTWSREGWSADVFIEVHAENNGGGDAGRGCFVVFPDWPAAGDVDADARDRIGPAVARGIAARTGIPVRGGGVMSERLTYIGSQGWRLGIFSATASLRQSLTRLLVEVGSYGSRSDLAIMQSPEFAQRCAAGIADGLGLKEPSLPRWRVASGPVNVRSGPGREYPVVGAQLQAGEVVDQAGELQGEVISGEARWLLIHRRGWVSAALLTAA